MGGLPEPPTPTSMSSDGQSSNSSQRNLGKRATYHPPAVSEKDSMASSGDMTGSSEKAGAHTNSIALACITLGLCCAVFMITLVYL